MKKYLLILTIITLTLTGCGLKGPSIEPTFDEFKTANSAKFNNASKEPAPKNDSQPTPNQPVNNSSMDIPNTPPQFTQATLVTNLGNLTLKFYPESPKTVNNFIKLAQAGFYDGVKFHRVIKDFMVQTGDPNSKDDNWDNDGQGGPGYQFADEINEHKLVRGSVAMANAGPNTNGSQFFIVTIATTPWLDGKHTNFGYLTDGLDILDKISAVKTNEKDHPLEDVTITQVILK